MGSEEHNITKLARAQSRGSHTNKKALLIQCNVFGFFKTRIETTETIETKQDHLALWSALRVALLPHWLARIAVRLACLLLSLNKRDKCLLFRWFRLGFSFFLPWIPSVLLADPYRSDPTRTP